MLRWILDQPLLGYTCSLRKQMECFQAEKNFTETAIEQSNGISIVGLHCPAHPIDSRQNQVAAMILAHSLSGYA